MKNKKPPHKELLSKRVFFRSDTARNEFFARLNTHFGSWKRMGNHFKIYKSKLERLRNGTVSIRHSLFLDLLIFLEKKEKKEVLQQIILKDKNWGRSKGGISTYKNHKDIFEKGRKIAANKPRKSKYKFQMDTPLTSNLCELMGAFIGDGFTNKYGSVHIIQYTGHSKLDYDYISNVLKPIIKEISPHSNPIITKKDNTMRMTIYSKEFHNLLTKRFRFSAGRKAYTVKIPEEIIHAEDSNLIKACIRGIFDTDGCVFYDKRKVYKKPYLRVQLGTVSIPLMKQVYSILSRFNLNPRTYVNYRKHVIQINGFENVKRFVKEIGFSNQRHSSKIKDLLN